MGRRAIEKMDPKEARQAVARHMRRLMSTSGVNMAQFKAQVYEEAMVDLLAGFAMDAGQPPSFRRDCAKDVLSYARGAIKPWIHDGETIDPSATGDSGSPVREEIEATRVTAEAYQELDDLVRRKVPPEQWPERIRALAGEAIAYYAGESSSGAA